MQKKEKGGRGGSPVVSSGQEHARGVVWRGSYKIYIFNMNENLILRMYQFNGKKRMLY